MKKVTSNVVIFVLAIMLFVLTGCGGSTGNSSNTNTESSTESGQTVANEVSDSEEVDEEAEGKLVGYCMPDTSEPFLAELSNGVQKMFKEEGVTVQIANAAGDSATQISQIENFAAMKADLIIVMAVDPTSVKDTIERAQASGSKILVAGSDTGAYDALMFIDQYVDGEMIAEMARDWINERYPDAEAGSINVAILESRDTPEASQRCDGIATITDICPSANVVKVVGGIKNNDAAQAATENLFQTNPDIKVILAYNSGAGLGANAFVMRPGSPIEDKSDFAVFCSDLDSESLQAVMDSATDESVLRGLIKFGGEDVAYDTYALAKKILNDEEYELLNPDPLTKILPENAAEFK